ncbi:16S rRNA (uracil(1498)-N(3))-methyltransferase [Methylophilus aquaticus]|uniref:Ribosomal RNA small subunit methyltransferase E n=1 Tax=Methylophilus aquaticus TaxID=1971610 RepID=A0ABT9JS65_9PROT|nr:16S rRNA (uracil(1498)-N(3))-methyltransferase [Methylophilus aquaticus]MDP8567417.1 16S rRNA (uracil(1498)-N(3))-methyltransferase [Methylophilus aquaticus]
MSNLRFHSPAPLTIGEQVPLSDNAMAHAVKVMRLKAGDTLTLFCGDGFDYQCALTNIEKKSAWVTVLGRTLVSNESALKIRLLQGISSGDRMDFTIQKAVELGVTDIYPIHTERSVTKLSGDRVEKRVEHWQGVAIAACEQSGRALVPVVHPPLTLVQWLVQHDTQTSLNILLNPVGAKKLAELPPPTGHIQLLIGPEGGLSANEIAAASQHHFQSIVLGPRILRTETAALTALASMQTVWGDF